ncbi:hypothetical protein ACI3RH_02065, partial [Lactococcus lactis]
MKSPIAINDISVKFGDKAILDHLSYEFESGKIICLIGPSVAAALSSFPCKSFFLIPCKEPKNSK